MNKLVRGRKKSDESQYYSGSYLEAAYDDEHKYQGEIGHFHWLKSEAIVPLRLIDGKPTAMIVLGHPDPRGLNLGGLAILEQCGGLIDAFYGLATFAGDRIEKARLLEQVASVLPLIASAETEVAFARAVCTLLTCNFGFRFDRALFFRMTGHTLPAECLMAVGGIGDEWPATREKIIALSQSQSLDKFIRSVLDHPLPQEDDGTAPDPLFAAACRPGNPLMYSEMDSPALDKLLKHGTGTAGGSVLRLSHDDPWIKASHHAREQMFFNRNNEFFVFALQPIKPESGSFPVGFVVADLPYSPWKHQSGPGFPDLAMVSITLKLLAGLWSFRNDSRSYFHILGALPLLRHSGGRVLETVDWIRDQLNKTPLPAKLEEDFARLRELAVDVARAKDIVDSLRRSGSQVQQLTLGKALLEFAERMKTRHAGLLADVTVSCPDGWTARIHQDALDEILMCLVDNAAVHGSKLSAQVRPWWMRLLWPKAERVSTPTTVAVRVNLTVMEHEVPESGGVLGKRLLLTVANDGEPIPPKLTPFLFCKPCLDPSKWIWVWVVVRTSIGQGVRWRRGVSVCQPREIRRCAGICEFFNG